ncbi:transposase [Caballeronia sp. LZ029]|nr:transposase [Caballeronia sp. LZ029]
MLEDANLKLRSVLSDLFGCSGRAMLEAIVAGEDNPERLTARKKAPELREALRSRITAHHRTLLKLYLEVIDALQRTLAELNATLRKALASFRHCVRKRSTVAGVSDVTTHIILAEVGADVTRFPEGVHLLSWAAVDLHGILTHARVRT